jgi:LacI family transcriptional regulator
LLQRLQLSGVPVVDVGDLFVGAAGIDSVLTDFAAWAQLAVEHFRSKGFENFAYFAPPSRDYSNLRAGAFTAAVERQGFACGQYRPGYRVGREISPEEHRRRVTRWLTQLPMPVAILAVDAARGKSLAEICVRSGFAIPDQVAVLAGDSDDLSCEICAPPLSSIEVASRRIGYEAAARLAERLNGGPVLESPVLVPPEGIQSRQSTDVLAIDDPLVVRALRFMQQNASQGITVADVLAEIPVARRQLERQFKRCLGRLPAEELRRLRLERGRHLLVDTELSMEEVAEACGYSGSTQFGAAFRSRYGVTPLSFRRRHQSE